MEFLVGMAFGVACTIVIQAVLGRLRERGKH
jgi:hypothetical protein